MPIHEEQRVLNYNVEQIFDLVIAVDNYPKFLPWCLSASLDCIQKETFDADLVIGFKLVQETFRSRIIFERPYWIEVTPISGPFSRMYNRWNFECQGLSSCVVSFHVDFEFKSRLLNTLMGALFQEAVRRMVGAFEERAQQLYGKEEVKIRDR